MSEIGDPCVSWQTVQVYKELVIMVLVELLACLLIANNSSAWRVV